MPKKQGVKDAPIQTSEHDALGLSHYAETLSNLILTADTPITIGIQGDWGSGKSSMMYLIQQSIRAERDNIHTIWFNAWQFSQFNMGDQLSISLLSHFIDEIEGLGKGQHGKNMQPALAKAKKALHWVMAAAVEKFVSSTIAEEILKESSKNIRELKTALSQLVAETLAKPNNRLVVFIDDIDRLVPEKAVDLLEALKLFLDIKGCVFVLACDRQVVVEGVKKKFGVEDEKGQDFFGKIIQVPFEMPVSQYNTDAYCDTLLAQFGIDYELTDIGYYVNLINASVGFNPRTIKRLFYNLLLFNQVLEKLAIVPQALQPNDRARMLFARLCLQEKFRPMYAYLLQAEMSRELFNRLSNPSELREGTEFEFLREQFRVELKKGEASFFAKLARFMDVLFKAILCPTKPKKANKALIQNRITAFKAIMSFSTTITSEEGEEEPEQQVDYDASTERARNRKLIDSVISEIENRYKTALEQLAPIMGKFKRFQPRYGDRELIIAAYSVIKSQYQHSAATLNLWLDAGSRQYSENGEKLIVHCPEYSSGCFAEPEWLEKNLQAFLVEEDNERYFAFHFEKLPPDTSREKLEKAFIDSAFKVLDKLLPRLVQLHKEGQL